MTVDLILTPRTTQCYVHTIPVGLRCHAIGVTDAANSLAVGVGLRLQQLWVCLRAPDIILSMAIRTPRLEGTNRVKT